MKNLKRSRAMKESWARRKAREGKNPTSSDVIIIPVPISPVTEVFSRGLSFSDWMIAITLSLSGAIILVMILGANPFEYLITALSFGYTGWYFGTRQ